MERDDLIHYVEFLLERLEEEKCARELSEKCVFDLFDKMDRMDELHQEKLWKQQRTIEDLTSAICLDNKNRFTSKKDNMSSHDRSQIQAIYIKWPSNLHRMRNVCDEPLRYPFANA